MQQLFNRTGAVLSVLQTGLQLGSRTVITATGTSSYTTPTGCRCLLVEGWSSGGGGSSASNSVGGQIAVGAGGAGGKYAISPMIYTTSGQVFQVSIGTGGAAGIAGAATTFTGGATAGQGFNFINIVGGGAGSGIATGTTEAFALGGGTSSAGTADVSAGNNQGFSCHRVSGTVAINGQGAAGPWGGRPLNNKAQVGTAPAGGKYGGGGTGGLSVNAAGASTGGAGGQGLVIVWEFY